MKSLKTFYRFLGKYKWRMLLFLSVYLISIILETIRPYWLKGVLDAAQNSQNRQVFYYFLLFGLSTVGTNFISTLAYHLADRVLIPLARHIRETVFRKVMELDFAYHVNKSTGSLISAFRRGDGAIFSLSQYSF